jgi:hypothetical protein
LSLAPDKVNVLTLEVDLRNPPVPVIAPDKVWFVDEPYVSVVEAPSEIAPAYVPDPSEPEPEIVTPPPLSLMVVEPVYVLVPDIVSVPALDLVKVPVPIATAPEIVVVPMPSTVRFVFVPDTPFDKVKVDDASTWISDAPPKLTTPEIVFEPAVLRSAPADDEPVPVMVIGSPSEIPPDTANVPPSETVVAPAGVPSAVAFDTASVPTETVVAPV